MPATEGVTGFGTRLELGNGVNNTSTSYELIKECKLIGGPSRTMETAEFTHQQSEDFYREFLPTFKDGGQITVELNFLPEDSTQGYATGVIYAYNNRLLQDYRLIWPNAEQSQVRFSAFVINHTPSAPLDGALTVQVTLKITGPVRDGNAASFTT